MRPLLLMSLTVAAGKFFGVFFFGLALKFRVHFTGDRVRTQRAAEEKDVRLRPKGCTASKRICVAVVRRRRRGGEHKQNKSAFTQKKNLVTLVKSGNAKKKKDAAKNVSKTIDFKIREKKKL